MNEASYMVDTRGPKPDLVKYEDGIFMRYDPHVPGEWKRSEFLDSMAHGGGDWVWFDDISDEKAEEYKAKIKDFYAKKG